jgi:hypothetical protein
MVDLIPNNAFISIGCFPIPPLFILKKAEVIVPLPLDPDIIVVVKHLLPGED